MSAYSDWKCGSLEDWQYESICREEEGEYEYEINPCDGCPNYEIQDGEDGKFGYCILGGGGNCDVEEI
jgi:hypothetical protein